MKKLLTTLGVTAIAGLAIIEIYLFTKDINEKYPDTVKPKKPIYVRR